MNSGSGTLLGSMTKMLPSSQARRGDLKLRTARELTAENESIIGEEDRRVIEERIAL
jgi:hypothetical protein